MIGGSICLFLGILSLVAGIHQHDPFGIAVGVCLLLVPIIRLLIFLSGAKTKKPAGRQPKGKRKDEEEDDFYSTENLIMLDLLLDDDDDDDDDRD